MPSNRVLVVEDDPSVRGLLQTILEDEALEVILAADGEEGLALARTVQPDVVLLDVMMPGLDGWTVAERLLADEDTREIPIVFLTARADVRDRARGIDLGGLDYVTKPFNPIELAPLVREAIDAAERGERETVRSEKIAALRGLFESG